MKKLLTICLILTALILTTCGDLDHKGSTTKSFDWDLVGTWKSSDTSVYNGTLEIERTRITISGYSESQTYQLGGTQDDNKRPFKGFTKNTKLEGYTEITSSGDNYINFTTYIKDAGDWYELDCRYYTEGSYPKNEFLRFTFGGREEKLKLQ